MNNPLIDTPNIDNPCNRRMLVKTHPLIIFPNKRKPKYTDAVSAIGAHPYVEIP